MYSTKKFVRLFTACFFIHKLIELHRLHLLNHFASFYKKTRYPDISIINQVNNERKIIDILKILDNFKGNFKHISDTF